MEEPEKDVMNRPPRSPKEGIFSGGVGFHVAVQGIAVTVITLASYLIGHYLEAGVWEITNSADGMTMAFLTLSMTEIFHSFNMRSLNQSVFTLKHHNPWLWLSMAASFLCTTVVIYVPFLSDAFEFEHISLTEYAVAIGLAFCIVPFVEGMKWLQRRRK